jgi:arsenate reductase
MSVELYGLSRCRKTQKAVTWLKERNISFNFHDFGRQGIDSQKLAAWTARMGYSELLNTKSPIFRKLPLALREAEGVDAQTNGRTLMQDEPRLINRPVLEYSGALVIGFEPELYAALFPQLPHS